MTTVFPLPGNNSSRPCVLLVDDSPEEQRRTLDVLRPHYRTIVAFDGQQGYQRTLASQPDLILMDVRMPRIDGFSACRLLKANPQTHDIPLIFLSSASTPAERVEGLNLGGVDYLAKPFAAEELLARIRIHLHLAQGRHSPSHPPQDIPLRTPEEVMVAAVIRLIEESLQAPPPLSELARKVGTYEKKLSQVFRLQTGLTVFAFIREERIRRASQLLAETDMGMQDIADLIGFQSAANFATAFREHMGMTPSAYRHSAWKGPATHAR